MNFQAAEHGLLLLQQKEQLQRDLNEATELNQKATQENRDLIQELERNKWVFRKKNFIKRFNQKMFTKK